MSQKPKDDSASYATDRSLSVLDVCQTKSQRRMFCVSLTLTHRGACTLEMTERTSQGTIRLLKKLPLESKTCDEHLQTATEAIADFASRAWEHTIRREFVLALDAPLYILTFKQALDVMTVEAAALYSREQCLSGIGVRTSECIYVDLERRAQASK